MSIELETIGKKREEIKEIGIFGSLFYGPVPILLGPLIENRTAPRLAKAVRAARPPMDR